MNIKEKLIHEYPLTKRVDCSFDCFEAMKRRYVIFYDKIIKRDNMELMLDMFDKSVMSEYPKSLIVVGYTDEQFVGEDLLFWNGDRTFVIYYLINTASGDIYFNDETNLFFGIGWKKVIRRFNEILR